MSLVSDRILKEVKETGISFSHVTELFKKETLEMYNNAVTYYNEFLASPHIIERCNRIASGNPIQDRSKWFEITQYEYLNRALNLSDGDIIKLYLSQEIVEIAEAFHKTTPRLRNVLTWVHPQNAIQQEIASQRWHRDQEDLEIFKVFIVMSDIGPNNGPTQYVKRTQHGGKFANITNNMNGKSTSDLKYPVPQEEVISCEGKAGTIIFMNTNGLHKGGLVKEGVRCLMQANFLKPDAHLIKIGTLPSFDYSDKINQIDKNLNEYKNLTDKQKLIIS